MRLLPLVFAALLVLVGCAAPPSQDIRTASDMTDADRRAKLRLELASGYYARGQATTALDEVKQALQARPDLVEGYSLRGLIYASLGEPKLAEESFQRALQLDPRSGDTMHNYGWFLCQFQRWDEASARFDQAIALPQYRDVPRTLQAKGLCEARAGKLRQADLTLSRSYEMDPGNPGTAFNLSDVLYRMGEFERARFYLRRLNADLANANAQTLWLAARVEQRLGNLVGVRTLGEQLRKRFPQSPEALQFEQGQFDG